MDVFSLGCIFYYVITHGKHPFGENTRRHENICQGKYNLRALIDNCKFFFNFYFKYFFLADYIALNLIEAMLNMAAEKRPTANAVAEHPMFWSKERQLQFLMVIIYI